MGNLSNLRPWRRGQSGNPGGRPKTKLLRDRLEPHDPKFVAALLKLLNDEDPHVRFKALELGMAYRWGKPTEAEKEPAPSPWMQIPAAAKQPSAEELMAERQRLLERPPGVQQPSQDELVKIAKGELK